MENTVITAVEPTDHARPIGDLTRFFRWDGERREYQMNSQIDPQIDTESWVSSPSPVRDRIISPNHNPTVGEIVHALNSATVREVRANARVDEVRQQAHDAIRIIGERLIQEAENRGWCDTFDQIIDEVNESLPGPFELPTRKKPRRKVRVQISSTVTTYEEVWVDDDCEDEDDPDYWYDDQESEYALGHDWATDKLMDEINYNGFDDMECSAY